MQAKQLVEITFPHKVLVEQNETITEIDDTVHDLHFVRDERGFAKFHSRKSGKHYFQAPGMIWYVEGE